MRRSRTLTVVANWRDASHPEAGGAERYCEAVARSLVQRGHSVVYLTAAVPGRPRREARDGYDIVRRGGRFGVYPAALAWLVRHRRRVGAVVDSQNGIPFFTPLAVRRVTPVLLVVHHVHQTQFRSYFPPALATVGRWLEGPASRWVYGRRAVVAVSPSTRRAIRLELKLRGPIHVASPGCSPPARPGRRPEERAERPRIVVVGRMVPHKRVGLAIRALPAILARHPDAELHLVGDGPERAELEALAEKVAPGRVTFHGSLSDERRDEVVRAAWIALNPSAGEGWGISVIEANALGVPVVAFHVAGLRDSIRDGRTGWLAPEGSDLGAAALRALQQVRDPADADRWCARLVAWAAQADWDRTASVLDGLLRAEAGRLGHQDRRQPTDLAAHVHLPADLLPPGWVPTFRLTDDVVAHPGGLSVVLPGADTADVATVLRRAGLPPAISHDPRLRVRLARPSDLVHPADDAAPAPDDAGRLRLLASTATDPAR